MGAPTDQPDSDGRVARHAARRHGIVTRSEALELGLTARQVDRRVATGRWERLRPGVYRTAGAPATPRQDLAAAVASLRGSASHLSGGWLMGLTDRPPRHEVTVTRSVGHHWPQVRVHRTSDLVASDLTVVDGIRTTDATRTCESDRERQNLLALEGWVVLRFTWRQICTRPEWVAAQVRAALGRAGAR